jgi:hypothetical protein
VKPLALVLVALILAGCRREHQEPPPIPTCEVRFAAPAGFEPLEPIEQRFPDRIGVRLGFRDAQDREFHVFAGIRGEFGEGLPDAGALALVDGGEAVLIGDGAVWIATWRLGDRCDPRAVIGTGFGRRPFLRALVDAGLVPATGTS